MTKEIRNKKKVSVVIPVFNGAKYLSMALDSVLESSFKDFEIVVVDDGSSDSSWEILTDYKNRHPDIFKIHKFSENKGMDHALNHALYDMAAGELIARFNQDDIMHPERLQNQVSYMDQHPECSAVGGQVVWIDEKGREMERVHFAFTDEEIRGKWMYISPFDDPSVMYRYENWVKTGGYDQDFWPADDVKMWYQLAEHGELVNLPEVVIYKRWHDDAGSSKIHRLQIKNTWKVHHWAKERYDIDVSLFNRFFWAVQYLSGLLMPPKFNWWVYRLIKGIGRG